MTIKLHLPSPLWQNKLDGAIQQRGTCWQPLNSLLEAKTPEQVGQALQAQNGFYALVWQQQNRTYAAVDHIRSIPLFYALKDQTFFLSDEAEWVREQVGNTKMDPLARDEFQLAGYVTGQDTLFPDVKQLQAGELLLVDEKNGLPELATERYYRFLHTEPESYNEADLYQQLDKAALASIDNLIRYANGRQIVIPLSGGYDSRLIAVLLKEANYDNILTFTYGAKGNKEAAYSKIVADNLGLEWRFVEYTEALWQAAWQTDERKRYQLEGSNWTSLAHLQDWLAVKIMKEQGIVENNAVFAPGHSGDMVAGSHIPNFIHADLSAEYTKDDLVEHLFNKHYCLTQHENAQSSVSMFKEKIEKSIVLQATYTAQQFANECEKHNWKNRQSKFIFNSARVYEFFDYDWWIPLWDKEFVRFFEDLPLSLRNHEWYTEYVQNKYLAYSKNIAEANVSNASDAGFAKRVSQLNIIKKLGIRPLLAKGYKLIVKPKSLLLLESAYNKKDVEELERKGYCSNGRVAYFFLKDFGS
ncbi:asparagine synthetase B family protein [Pseudomonas sp. OIL-1]|uniref:asparagine synthase-related protein n=1 Tax=Pseudomonas sp. OIL-1 TaxID=2706126 RepID=UPI0013A72625|nr:asparagine synthetase B family protein [Pseudomonas sp. OIL-1]QIB52618.1 hypothetical protein G3M63_17145 [Pseudomonas sp. OIL-1]